MSYTLADQEVLSFRKSFLQIQNDICHCNDNASCCENKIKIFYFEVRQKVLEHPLTSDKALEQ
jgi:hypothetical protein